MNTTILDLEAGGVVPVIHPDTGKRYFLLRINADVPLYGLMRDDEDGGAAHGPLPDDRAGDLRDLGASADGRG